MMIFPFFCSLPFPLKKPTGTKGCARDSVARICDWIYRRRYLWFWLSFSFMIFDMPPLVICVEKTCPNHHGRYLDFAFFRFLRFCKIARHEVFACTLFLIHVITKFHPSQFQIKGITRFAHSKFGNHAFCSFNVFDFASLQFYENVISIEVYIFWMKIQKSRYFPWFWSSSSIFQTAIKIM